MLSPRLDIKSVSQITNQIKKLLEVNHRFIHVRGEISNLATPRSGHSYFILKDAASQLKCVMFKGQKRRLEKALADGQEVICHGRITVYEPRGEYQMVIDTLDQDGSGSLQAEFEQTKRKLEAEGLFAPEHKRKIPAMTQKVLVITSPTGAALQDFLKIHRQNNSPCSITIYPVSVQGSKAAAEITAALQYINQHLSADCVVICRGGGSLEDLWCFNDETLAREIFASKLPVITAIGHETDFTIADFCADKRCPTPTAAAALLFADTGISRSRVISLQKRLHYAMQNRLEAYRQQLKYHHKVLTELHFLLDHTTLRVDHLNTRLHGAMTNRLKGYADRLNTAKNQIHQQSPVRKIFYADRQLEHLSQKMQLSVKHLLDKKSGELARAASTLDAVSPLATMSRGYSVVQKYKNMKIITSSSSLKERDRLEIRLHRGRIACLVEKVIE